MNDAQSTPAVPTPLMEMLMIRERNKRGSRNNCRINSDIANGLLVIRCLWLLLLLWNCLQASNWLGCAIDHSFCNTCVEHTITISPEKSNQPKKPSQLWPSRSSLLMQTNPDPEVQSPTSNRSNPTEGCQNIEHHTQHLIVKGDRKKIWGQKEKKKAKELLLTAQQAVG